MRRETSMVLLFLFLLSIIKVQGMHVYIYIYSQPLITFRSFDINAYLSLCFFFLFRHQLRTTSTKTTTKLAKFSQKTPCEYIIEFFEIYDHIYIYIFIQQSNFIYLFIYKLLINMIRREEMVLEDQFIARRMVITAQEVSKRSITVFMKITMDLKITSPSTIELFLLLF